MPDTMLGTLYVTSYLVFVNVVLVRHCYLHVSGKDTESWKVKYLFIVTQLLKRAEAERHVGPAIQPKTCILTAG